MEKTFLRNSRIKYAERICVAILLLMEKTFLQPKKKWHSDFLPRRNPSFNGKDISTK